MFVSNCNTYLALDNGRLTLCFLSDYCDGLGLSPATAEDMRSRRYRIEHTEHKQVAFFRDNKGYLAVEGDLSLRYGEYIGRWEAFREINPDILPEPLRVLPEEKTLTKNIHQIGIYPDNPGAYPKVFLKNRNHVIALNPDYKFYFWSEGGAYDIESFIEKTYGEQVVKYYRSISHKYPAARADLFRYLCLYACGGVYFDLKTSFAYPFSQIIRPKDRFLLSFWYHSLFIGHEELRHMPYAEYEQYYIICAAGHPLMRKIIMQVLCNIRLYDPDISGSSQYGVLRLTGPIAYSMIIDKHKDKYRDKVRHIHSLSNGVEYTIFNNIEIHKGYSSKGEHYESIKESIVNNSAF